MLLDIEHRNFFFLDNFSMFLDLRLRLSLGLFLNHIFHLLFREFLIALLTFNVYCILKAQR